LQRFGKRAPVKKSHACPLHVGDTAECSALNPYVFLKDGVLTSLWPAQKSG